MVHWGEGRRLPVTLAGSTIFKRGILFYHAVLSECLTLFGAMVLGTIQKKSLGSSGVGLLEVMSHKRQG